MDEGNQRTHICSTVDIQDVLTMYCYAITCAMLSYEFIFVTSVDAISFSTNATIEVYRFLAILFSE